MGTSETGNRSTGRPHPLIDASPSIRFLELSVAASEVGPDIAGLWALRSKGLVGCLKLLAAQGYSQREAANLLLRSYSEITRILDTENEALYGSVSENNDPL